MIYTNPLALFLGAKFAIEGVVSLLLVIYALYRSVSRTGNLFVDVPLTKAREVPIVFGAAILAWYLVQSYMGVIEATGGQVPHRAIGLGALSNAAILLCLLVTRSWRRYGWLAMWCVAGLAGFLIFTLFPEWRFTKIPI